MGSDRRRPEVLGERHGLKRLGQAVVPEDRGGTVVLVAVDVLDELQRPELRRGTAEAELHRLRLLDVWHGGTAVLSSMFLSERHNFSEEDTRKRKDRKRQFHRRQDSDRSWDSEARGEGLGSHLRGKLGYGLQVVE